MNDSRGLLRADLAGAEYQAAVTETATWAAERRAGTMPDRLFLISNSPVVTYGRRTPPTDLPSDLSENPDAEVRDVVAAALGARLGVSAT